MHMQIHSKHTQRIHMISYGSKCGTVSEFEAMHRSVKPAPLKPRKLRRIPTTIQRAQGPMKAIVQDRYGSPSPDVLRLSDVEMPSIGDDQILVKIHAASVNALDYHVTRGRPYFMRLFGGISKPKERERVRGVDLGGRVESVGKNITSFKPGDEVFGGSDGTFAEYTATTTGRLAHMPAGLSFGEAASLHVAGLTALQGLRDKAQLKPGERVLIYGAGGGVGSFAVQIAKWLGAHVTAVTRTKSVEMVRSIGADDVIDHRTQDFTKSKERYDVLFDIGGNRPFAHYRRVMTEKGRIVVVGAPQGRWLEPATHLLKAAVLSPFVSQQLVPFVCKNDAAGLTVLKELTEAGNLRVVVDRHYALSETAEAIRHVGAGHARGKVIINVA
jgi:NADPH:quinone reductase-like Zn-dependent oxidoreductase